MSDEDEIVPGAGALLHAILNPPPSPYVHTFAPPLGVDDPDDPDYDPEYVPPVSYTLTDYDSANPLPSSSPGSTP